jgi:hypothetical protein
MVIVASVLLLCVAFSASPEVKKMTVEDVLLLKSIDMGEEAILRKIADSGTTFSADDLEKFRSGGFSADFITQVENLMKAKLKVRKLSVADILNLKRLDIREETLLKKIKDSGTTFSADELEELENGGMSKDFLDAVEGRTKGKAGEADLAKARKEFGKNIDELGDCFQAAAETMEEFTNTFKELLSQKEAGKLSQRRFGQSLDKAAGASSEPLEEIHRTVLELKESIDAAPDKLKEKKAGVEVASLIDQYVKTLREAIDALEPVAKGTGSTDEFENGLEAAAELKGKIETAYEAYEALLAEHPAVKQLNADFSTPLLAVKTFLDACAAKNLNLLSQCFAEEAEEEFQAIREKTISREDLDEFVGIFKGATITVAKEEFKGNSASVGVKFAGDRGQETLVLVKENGQWKILEF